MSTPQSQFDLSDIAEAPSTPASRISPRLAPRRSAPAAPLSVDPRLDSFVNEVIGEASKRTGYTYKLGEGVRTPEQQAGKVAKGVSWTYDSPHMHGRGRDVLAFDRQGKYITDGAHEAYKALGDVYNERAAAGPVPVKWGVVKDDKQVDPGHFQIEDSATPALDLSDIAEPAPAFDLADIAEASPAPADDYGEAVTINSAVDRHTGLALSFDDGGKVAPVASEAQPVRPAPVNLQTQEGRAVRDSSRADAHKSGSFVPVAVPLSRAEETDPGSLPAGDAVRRGVHTWAEANGVPGWFVDKWMSTNAATGYSLHVHGPGGDAASTLIDSGAPYDAAHHAYTVEIDAQHLSKLKDDYAASKGTLQRASDFVSSDEESPGEKVLDVAAPVAGAVGKVGGYVARPFQATSAGVFAGLRGENPFREAFHTFTTGEHTDKGSNPLGNFLRDNRTLASINPRLGRLLGGAADVVFDPANLIGLGIVGKGARALAGAGRLGRVAEEVGAVGKSLGLLERGIVDARPLGLGEAVADVSSTAAKGGEAAALEGAAQSATREGSRYSVASPGGATHEGTIEALSERDVARLTAAGSDPAKFVRLRTPEGGYVVAERGALSVPYDVEMKTADGARLLHSTATGETRNAATGEAVPLDEGPSPAVRAEMARYSRERADFHAREAKTASNPAARANAQGLADEYSSEAARLEAGDGAAPEGSASGIAPRSQIQPRSLLRRAGRAAVDLVQLPKTKAGWDLSATGRQALPQILAHPSYFKDAMAEQVKAFASEDAFNNFVGSIKGRPDFDLMRESGLYLSSAGSGPEEAFASGLVKKIPGVKGSERAFSAALDSVRVQAWDNYTAAVADNPNVTPETHKAIAELVNISTGRGIVPVLDRSALGKHFINALNVPFFSPRNMAGKFNLISPARIIRNAADPATRPVAWLQARDATRGLATLSTTLGLAHVAGLDVGLNPFSDDFGKLRVGNAVYDLTGGEGMSVRYLAKMARSFREIEQGKPLKKGQTLLDLTRHYLRSQLQPAAAAAVDLQRGKNFAGQPVTGADVAADLVVPFVLDDLYRGWVDAGGSTLSDVWDGGDSWDGGKDFKTAFGGAARGLPGVFGVGTAFYPKREGERGSGIFPRGQSSYTSDDSVDAAPVVASNEMRLEGQRESGNVIDARDPDMEAERARAGMPGITEDEGDKMAGFLQHRLSKPQFEAFAKSLDESVKMGVAGEGADAVAEYVSKALNALGAHGYADSAELARIMRLLSREARLRPLQFSSEARGAKYGVRLMESFLNRVQYPQNNLPRGSAGRSSAPRGISSDAPASDAPAVPVGHLFDQPQHEGVRESVEGADADAEPTFRPFPADLGSLDVPRSSMPQVRSAHRGAMVQFLKRRGISHNREEIAPNMLKPSQAEYSPEKAQRARSFAGPSRAILISADNHVADGHHQWLADLHDAPTKPVPVIRLNAPIQQLLLEMARFPSSGVSESRP